MSIDATARVLQLLALLSGRRGWTGDELAGRLGVTDRTLRRDVERLRLLGYQIEGTRGSAGGYELRAGTDLPPLFLEDDEAIAIVAALMVAGAQHSTGMDASTTAALAKLHHVMPAPLIARLAAVQSAASAISGNRFDPTAVDPESVAALAEAARDRMRVTFGYRNRDGTTSERRVEPHHVITPGRVWYLIGFDLDRADWRTFRIDRVRDLVTTGHRFDPRPLPDGDPGAFLSRAIARTPMAYGARVRVPVARDRLRSLRPALLADRITPGGRHACAVALAADDLDALVVQIIELVQVAEDCSVQTTDVVHDRLRTLTDRLGSVAAGS